LHVLFWKRFVVEAEFVKTTSKRFLAQRSFEGYTRLQFGYFGCKSLSPHQFSPSKAPILSSATPSEAQTITLNSGAVWVTYQYCGCSLLATSGVFPRKPKVQILQYDIVALVRQSALVSSKIQGPRFAIEPADLNSEQRQPIQSACLLWQSTKRDEPVDFSVARLRLVLLAGPRGRHGKKDYLFWQ
jgi:hypothetical protein